MADGNKSAGFGSQADLSDRPLSGGGAATEGERELAFRRDTMARQQAEREVFDEPEGADQGSGGDGRVSSFVKKQLKVDAKNVAKQAGRSAVLAVLPWIGIPLLIILGLLGFVLLVGAACENSGWTVWAVCKLGEALL